MKPANDAYGALLYPESAGYVPAVPKPERHKAASHIKSIAKCFTWRGVAAIDTLCIVLLVTGGSAWAALAVVGLEGLSKICWMYGHERLWETAFMNRLISVVEGRRK